jgi:hypothetical protein
MYQSAYFFIAITTTKVYFKAGTGVVSGILVPMGDPEMKLNLFFFILI